jgi:hypothetical protein
MKTITLPERSLDYLPDLANYLKPFSPLFQSSTNRRSLEYYVPTSDGEGATPQSNGLAFIALPTYMLARRRLLML